MGALFMAAVVACRSLNNAVLNTVAKTRIKSRSGHYLFATMASLIALLFVITISHGIPEIESGDILHGIILGVLGIAEEFFVLSALECGSMAATTIMTFMSFSLTNVVAIPLFGKALTVLDWIGIAVSVICILILFLDLCNKGIEGEHARKKFSHWKKYALILLACTALVEIAEKCHAETALSENHMGYYFVAFLSGTVLALILFLRRYKGKHEQTYFIWDMRFIFMILFCGIMKAVIYIVIGRAAAELTMELVTIINGCAVIAVVTILDIFYFKTKLRWNQFLAALLAIISIIIVW